MTTELLVIPRQQGTLKYGQDRSLQLMCYKAEVETAPAGKRFWSWTVRNFHSLFAHACSSSPTPFYTSSEFLQKHLPPKSLPGRTVPAKTKHKSPFSSCGYLVWTRLVRSPPSSRIMLRGCPSLKYRVCSMHHKYSSSVSPFQANTAREQTQAISQFLTQHVVKQPKEDFISSQQQLTDRWLSAPAGQQRLLHWKTDLRIITVPGHKHGQNFETSLLLFFFHVKKEKAKQSKADSHPQHPTH